MVPAMGLGCMGLSVFYEGRPSSDEDRFKVLDCAAELGETFWVTADGYGDNEDLIGKWFTRTGDRSEIFLATKFGRHGTPSAHIIRSDPEYVKAACEKSLKRLGIPKIDLYLAHRLDGKVPIEKTVQAMVDLKNEGKIDYLGLSEVSAATLRRACKVHQISAVEVEYSPFAMEIESEQINLLQTCREFGVAIIGYSPLGRGMFSGRYKSPTDFPKGDSRGLFPRFSAENFPKNLVLVEKLVEFANRKKCTPAQLTLAWLLAQGKDIFPIPGTTRTGFLEENLGAFDVKLSEEEVAKIRKFVEESGSHGDRYPARFTADLFRDTPPLV